ncbi:hypothetical protein Daus18300_012173 [Diaporthe australafricana]|uniref:F-box domain-containing protein n=1 Tax=Diaporthe australafricana TaxID=127596 RepID=A0ABR3W3M3_9PEZI
MPDPQFTYLELWEDNLDANILMAKRFNNQALPEFCERLINDGQLRQQLMYLSVYELPLKYKAGVTKQRLRLFIASSISLGIPVPNFVQGLLQLPNQTRADLSNEESFFLDEELWLLDAQNSSVFQLWITSLLLFRLTPQLRKLNIDPVLAQEVFFSANPPAVTLPTITTIAIPRAKDFQIGRPAVGFQMESLLRSFPNLRALHSEERKLSWSQVRRVPALGPPLYPNLRKLILAPEQPGRLHHVSQILHEFPQLEELSYSRRPSQFLGENDPGFSNADLFRGVHSSLRKLTYSTANVLHFIGGREYLIIVELCHDMRLADEPQFRGFSLLEDLTIDQILLGRMSTARDRVDSPYRPFHQDLDYKLPQSLCRLTIQYVYDFVDLAYQLAVIASAKRRGEFPNLRDIHIVVAQSGSVTYSPGQLPHVPLLPIHIEGTRRAVKMMEKVGINLRTTAAEIAPPPGESEDYKRRIPSGHPVEIRVRPRFFLEI